MARRARQAAATAVQSATAIAEKPQDKPKPYLRNVPGKRAVPADPITGEALRPHTYFLRVSSERMDWPALPDIEQPAETTPCPSRLHTTVVEMGGQHGGGLGGHCFSRDFARYLAKVLPMLVERREFALTHWWANDYWAGRVRAQFVARFGTADGQARFDAALYLRSDYRTLDTLRETTGRSVYWLQTQVNIAEAFAYTARVRVVRAIEPKRTSARQLNASA